MLCGYTFAGSKDDEGVPPILVYTECKSKVVFSRSVPGQGLDSGNHPVRVMTDDLDSLGYKKMIFKGDGEPSLTAVRSGSRIKESIVIEDSVAYDSQSNGEIESANRSICDRNEL